MAVQGSPLDLSDDELAANAEVERDRDFPMARDWAQEHFDDPFVGLLTAEADPNDPATPDEDEPASPDGES
jgi:hypothetical protein